MKPTPRRGGRSIFVRRCCAWGVTLNDLIRTATNAADTRYSFQGDLAFGRFMLVGEYGIANTTQQNNPDRLASPYTYNSQGSFLRIGVDVNLLKDREANDYDAAGSILLFGLRFGRAQINDQLSYELTDPLWGTTVPHPRKRRTGGHLGRDDRRGKGGSIQKRVPRL